MRRIKLPPAAVGVLAALVAVTVATGLVSRDVVTDENSRLLHERVGEVGLLLGTNLNETQRSLRAALQAFANDPSPAAFDASAKPLLTVRARAVTLAARTAGGFRTLASLSYGDGPAPGAMAPPSLAAVLDRASLDHDVVSGIVTDAGHQRLVLAVGSPVGAADRVVYQENAIDPFVPDPATSASAFTELTVAMYAAPAPDPRALILSTAPVVPSPRRGATTTIGVGTDTWLVVASARGSLVGPLAEDIPWIILILGLLTAVLAATVVAAVSRRRDYALRLVEERTAEVSSSLRALQAAQSALRHQAFTDSLTGLPNRTLLQHRLHRPRRPSGGASDQVVLFVDLDRFKWVNDSLGHTAGDALLVAVAERFRRAVRPEDTVARFGGDEFVVLCDVDDPMEATVIAARLTGCLAAPFELNGRELRLTASVGIASARSGDLDAALRDADAAMYSAKDQGRDRVQLFDQSMRSRAIARLDVESALTRAVENGELCVFYQPVIETRTGRVRGAEALVRWLHPQRGPLLPAEFIPIAEDNGLIVPIGRFVLQEACAQVARWNRARIDRPPLMVGVNLSPRQLNAEGVGDVKAALDNTGLEPRQLVLEITESALMIDFEASCAAMHAMKRLGVMAAVDDFGTGYASLKYVRRLPVDALKVDQSFVAGLGHSSADSAIVAGVVNLARALGMTAVAEGVERVEQLEELTRLDCELTQGWWWGPAMPAVEFERWLADFETRHAPTIDLDAAPRL